MGECLKNEENFVAPYQNYVSSVFDVPLQEVIKNVWGFPKQPMFEISKQLQKEKLLFKDTSVLGVFVDNHDLKRFLSMHDDVTMFKSALIFSFTTRGIPFMYQGGEFGYKGGDDPQNREYMWKDISQPENHIQKMIKIVNKARKDHEIWEFPLIERKVMSNFYAYTRGKFLVALTN